MKEGETEGVFVCSECESNEYKLTDGKCEKCDIFICDKCHFNEDYTEQICDKCVDGYYKSSSGECKNPKYGEIKGGYCYIYSDDETDFSKAICTCNKGYAKVGETECIKCNDNCNKCIYNENTKMTSCLNCLDYYILNSNKECVHCGDECRYCDLDEEKNKISCLACDSGILLSDNTCLKTLEGCLNHLINPSSANKNEAICTQCDNIYNNIYILSPDNKCLKCEDVAGEGCSKCEYDEQIKKYICLDCNNYEYIYDSNIPNISYNSIQNNNLIYKKPSINNNNENQIFEEIKNNDIIQEIKDNIKQNETKLEKVNKTVQDIYINQDKEQNISKETKDCYSQINEIEKIQQENLTLKADSIIYREDIMHLSEINRKLKFELDLAQKKIFDLISKGENINQILNKKNYELSLLTEAISNIKLTNSGEIMKKIKSNKTKEQQIFEYEFELNGLNNEKIKLETEIKNLEERYNTLLEEKNKNEKEEEFYKIRINENIFGLENKIKKMGKQMNDLSIINKQLKLTNQKYEQSINQLKNEKNNFIDKYTQKQEQFNELEKEFKNLENKYSQALYDMQKRSFKQENEKNQEIKNDYKPKKRKSSKQIIVNDLYNKIQELKENIKSERNMNDYE